MVLADLIAVILLDNVHVSAGHDQWPQSASCGSISILHNDSGNGDDTNANTNTNTNNQSSDSNNRLSFLTEGKAQDLYRPLVAFCGRG